MGVGSKMRRHHTNTFSIRVVENSIFYVKNPIVTSKHITYLAKIG
jgi:hypothetical protein